MNTEKEQEALEWEGYMSIDTGIKEGKLLIAAIAKIMSMYQLHFSKQEILKDLIPTAKQMFKTFNLNESYSRKIKFVEFNKFAGFDDDNKIKTYPITINIHEIVLITRNKIDELKTENCSLFLPHGLISSSFTVIESYESVIKKIENILKPEKE